MKYAHVFGICIVFCGFFFSCQDDESFQQKKMEAPAGSLEAYFKKINQSTNYAEIIELANKALAVADDQDTLLSNLLDIKVYYHGRLQQYDSSLYFADSLLSLSRDRNDTAWMRMAYSRKFSLYFYHLPDYEKAYKNAFQAQRLYLSTGDSLFAGRRSLDLARVQRRAGDHSGSQESATQALSLFNKEKNPGDVAQAYTYIGLSYWEQGFYKQASQEYRRALPFATTQLEKFSLRNNLALVKMEEKDYEFAIQTFEELVRYTDSRRPAWLALYKENLAYARWLQNPDLDLEEAFLEAYELRKAAGEDGGLIDSYDRVCDYYKKNNSDRALEMALDHLEVARKRGQADAELHALEDLIELAPVEEVRSYANQFVRLSDSLNRKRLREKNAFAKIRFDEENKQREILGLQINNARQGIEVEKMKNRVLVGSLLGALLLLGLSFLIYFLRNKYRAEKVREVHRTETRIAKRIHDELANDVYNVMSSLEIRGVADAVDRLEQIYKRTRDFSRENAEIETGPNFAEDLVAMLGFYPTQTRLILKGNETVNWNRYSEEKKIVVYRVLQELMVNMKKHSEAKLVALSFSEGGNSLKITYSDIGKGADPKKIGNRNGLRNLEVRLASVEGRVIFDTFPGKGFKAEITLPI